MTGEATEDESSTEPPPADEAEVLSAPEAGSRPPGLVLAVSLAVIFALAAAVFGVLALGSDDGESDRVSSLRVAAGQMGEAFFTYHYQDLDAHKAKVLELATGSFRNEYEDEFERGLRGIITEVESTSQGFVKDIYVSEIDEERAEAIVVLDVDQDGTGGPRTLFDVYVLLTFVEVGGDWKVDDVTDPNLPFGGGGDPGVGTDTTSTTTAAVPVP